MNPILDKSILFSFDRIGFQRHKQSFDKHDLEVDLKGKRCLITGANSGLGLETARGLAKLGAKVVLLCRNRDRGLEAVRKIQGELLDIHPSTRTNSQLELEVLDISDLPAIRKFVKKWGDVPVDILIHNAGILPRHRTETNAGIELTLATNLIGPFLLTNLLLPNLKKSEQARVIYVASGGMYLQKLDLKDLESRKKLFGGVKAYVNTKRAGIIITELFAKQTFSQQNNLLNQPSNNSPNNSPKHSKITFNAMHPGWADTPSVKKSLPLFWKLTKSHLRTPLQGADTIIWLAACVRIEGETGKFWFDRQKVPTHAFKWTQETKTDREQLWKLCCDLSGMKN